VSAVAAVAGGAHPSPVQGYYGRDHAFYSEYHGTTREREGFLRWLKEWILDVPDHDAYLARLGARFARLRPTQRRLAAAVDYA
jgi:glutaconate CoA-transferase subunit A